MMRMQSSIVGNNEIKFQVYGVETHFFDLQDSEKQNICIFFVSLLNVWSRDRSSRPECSVKKGVLRNFAKFTRKRLCQSLFFNKIAGWGLQLYLKRDSGTGCPYNCPKNNCPPPPSVRVRVCFRVSGKVRVRGNCPRTLPGIGVFIWILRNF